MPVSALIPALISGAISAGVESTSVPATSQQLQLEAAASARPFPAETKRGEMQPPANGTVVIDGNILTLAPAAQIRTAQNLIIMPAAIQQTTTVRYLTDASGAVFRVWVLTPAEIAASDTR